MPKNKLKIYPQISSKPKCVIMTLFFLFFVFAGTPSIVAPSGHFLLLNSAVGQTSWGGLLTDVSYDSWIVEGSLWLGLIIVEHTSLAVTNQLVNCRLQKL